MAGGRQEGGIYGDIEFPPDAGEDPTLPYVFVNTITSVDGKTAVEGKASGLGTAADRNVMRALRSKADAVMIGGGTLRAEKLALGLDEDDPRPRPLAVVLTNTGQVPLESNLVRDRRQSLLVVVGERADKGVERRLGGLAEVGRAPTTGSGLVDLEGCLRMLKSRYDVDRLLVEGGPTLNHALISRHLVGELFLTVAPRLIGGSGAETPSLLKGPKIPAHDRPALELVSVHLVEDELFLRYSLARSASCAGP